MGIIGGKPLISEFPELGQTALYCVTELHTSDEIDKLKENLESILGC
jgi:glycine dehydrogenase subunit 1